MIGEGSQGAYAQLIVTLYTLHIYLSLCTQSAVQTLFVRRDQGVYNGMHVKCTYVGFLISQFLLHIYEEYLSNKQIRHKPMPDSLITLFTFRIMINYLYVLQDYLCSNWKES